MADRRRTQHRSWYLLLGFHSLQNHQQIADDFIVKARYGRILGLSLDPKIKIDAFGNVKVTRRLAHETAQTNF
jgi:hypothetical protein